jgi:hypothetical protein
MIRFTDKTIRHGSRVWTVSGVITRQRVVLDLNRLYGDVTCPDQLQLAVAGMVAGSRRYQRVIQ